ncbi:MAG: glycosyltransferase, partial [Cyanobacteria bacterium P01_G01_bin.19]
MFKFIRQRAFKFLLGGGVAAAFNLLLIFILIEWLGFTTPLLRNVANIISIELSLILSFFIYRIWVWPGGNWNLNSVLLKQLPLYHLSAGSAVLLRVLVVFPLLDNWGVPYGINTIVGVLLSAVLNYLISDRLVFKDREQGLQIPEGLESSRHQAPQDRKERHNLDYRAINLFSIVIPAYNEEGSIVKTLESLSQTLDESRVPHEILVVNDNSRDRTEAILQDLCQYNPNVRYINNYYPNGFGFAV